MSSCENSEPGQIEPKNLNRKPLHRSPHQETFALGPEIWRSWESLGRETLQSW